MAYTLKLTNGKILLNLSDQKTDELTTSLTLIGKNVSAYGTYYNSNFIHLLENGANSTPPGAPLTGQLWWDSSANLLKVYNGTTFKTISAATASSPVVTSTGTAVPLLPGTDEILTFVPNAYFTGTTSSGTATVYIIPGDGM